MAQLKDLSNCCVHVSVRIQGARNGGERYRPIMAAPFVAQTVGARHRQRFVRAVRLVRVRAKRFLVPLGVSDNSNHTDYL